MTITEVKGLQEFRDTLKKHPTVLVDFWAPWCGPCRAISPKIKQFSEDYPSIHFIKVNVDEAQDVAEEYGIKAMPTFILFKNGEKAGEVVGAEPRAIGQLIEGA